MMKDSDQAEKQLARLKEISPNDHLHLMILISILRRVEEIESRIPADSAFG